MADAVTYEPVSTAKFPANREINREFCRIRLLCAILKPTCEQNHGLAAKFPTQRNREFLQRNREFARENRDSERAIEQSHSRMIFSEGIRCDATTMSAAQAASSPRDAFFRLAFAIIRPPLLKRAADVAARSNRVVDQRAVSDHKVATHQRMHDFPLESAAFVD